MIFFESFLVALSTYSAIPVLQFDWNEKNMKYAICFLPAVGIICGAILSGWYILSDILNISDFFFSVIAVCIPVLITGGIHIDGYMDTVDALSSYQVRERKLEILKDPHCGAFSVIYCIIYFLLNLAFVYELNISGSILVLCPMFTLSRALSVLCAVNMPNARKSGMLCAYTQNAERKWVNTAMTAVGILSAFAMVLISPVMGGIAVCGSLISVFFYCRMAKKQFGGVTGDTAGFFLQICELSCIAGAWIGALLI